MTIIPLVSIVFEIFIAALALFAVFRGRSAMIGFAITFGVYVYYDLARYYEWQVSEPLLSLVFLIATLSAFLSMVALVKNPTRSH